MSERLKILAVFPATLAGWVYSWFGWIQPGLGRANWSYYIIPGLYGVVCIGLWVGLAYRWFVQLPREELLEAVEASPASFSLIAFHDVSRKSVLDWLGAIGFSILRSQKRSGPFLEVVGALASARSYHHTHVCWMCCYQAGAYTVLVDLPAGSGAPSLEELESYHAQGPDTLLRGLAFADDALSRFCSEHSTMATVARWDRLTASVVLRDFGASGLLEQTVFFGGERAEWGENSDYVDVREDAQLAADPNPDALLRALARRGIDGDAVFGDVEAEAVELDASPMLGRSQEESD